MHFEFPSLDEVEAIILASGKQVGHLLAVLATVDVVDELLTSECVVFVEWAGSLRFILVLLEHLLQSKSKDVKIMKRKLMSIYISKWWQMPYGS